MGLIDFVGHFSESCDVFGFGFVFFYLRFAGGVCNCDAVLRTFLYKT